ncbi:MAG: hypothetical protein V3S33_07220, partial [Gammaproteobacteria bacterium]
CMANGRRLTKWLKSRLPGTHAPPAYHLHRYPDICLPDLRRRMSRLQQVIGDNTDIKVEEVRDQIFRISA